jgi:hypothetical protein
MSTAAFFVLVEDFAPDEQAENKCAEEQNKEQDKQELRDRSSASRDIAEAKQPGDQSDDEEQKCEA